jgi:hypothetical protein
MKRPFERFCKCIYGNALNQYCNVRGTICENQARWRFTWLHLSSSPPTRHDVSVCLARRGSVICALNLPHEQPHVPTMLHLFHSKPSGCDRMSQPVTCWILVGAPSKHVNVVCIPYDMGLPVLSSFSQGLRILRWLSWACKKRRPQPLGRMMSTSLSRMSCPS